MSDPLAAAPDYAALYGLAATRAGYFTAADARQAGYSWALLSHHARSGLIRRVSRGVYRLRNYPSTPHEELVAVQTALGPSAVISHESALDVLELSDVIPNSAHVTVPRSRRSLLSSPGVTVHTVTRPLAPNKVVVRGPLRVTSPARTIVDVSATGLGPDQVHVATRGALSRGLVTPGSLRREADDRSRRVRDLIERALTASLFGTDALARGDKGPTGRLDGLATCRGLRPVLDEPRGRWSKPAVLMNNYRQLVPTGRPGARRVVEALEQRGHLRPSDLAALGIPRSTLYRMTRQGLIVRVQRGVYTLPSAAWPPAPLADVARQVPSGHICLLSALQFHGLTTQAPFEIWVAVHPKARRPAVKWPPVRIVRFSGESLTAGVEQHDIDGASVAIYGPAKTVADCFKYRNKIGLDVAIEALRSAWRERTVTMDELWHYARICRVARVMRPYLESVV